MLVPTQARSAMGVADLMHTLWEADVSVFKAHITTSPARDVLDMFWLYDNRRQLPDHHRWAAAASSAPPLSSSPWPVRTVTHPLGFQAAID